jgi:MFS family permease
MLRFLRTTFAALALRNFAVLWAGSFLAFTAFFMSTVVQAIVAFDLTGKNGAVGIVMLGQGLAMAILGPFGGAIADRVSKRFVTAACQLVIGLVFLAIAVLIATDTVSVLFLGIGSFVIGTMFAFMGPARQAWVVELVGPELRANAVALTQVALNASRIIAPALGGLLVAMAFVGASGAYFAMAGMYVVVVLSLLLLPATQSKKTNDKSVLGDMMAGIAYTRSQPRLRAMMALFFMMIVLGLSAVTILPGLVENELGRDVEAFGILQAISAVGGLVASLAVAPFAGSSRALAIYSVTAALMGASLVLTGLTPNFLIAFVPMFLYGFGSGAFQTLNMAVIVTETDPAYYGRVSSLTMLAFAGFMLAGLPLGLLADAIGERLTLMIQGVGIVAIVAIMTPIIARTPSSTQVAHRRMPAGEQLAETAGGS